VRAAAAAALVLLAAATARAQEADDEAAAAQMDGAAALQAEERWGEAAAAFAQLAERWPDSSLAADALFAAAQLREERLADPAGAAALYDRLTRRYPHSRPAVAAGRRAAALRTELGDSPADVDALSRFNDVLQRYPERGEQESIAIVEQLLAEYPDWPGAPRAVLWLAETHWRADRRGAAERRWLEAAERWPGTDAAEAGWRGAGDVAVRQREFVVAAERYRKMVRPGDPASELAFEDAMSDLGKAKRRHAIYLVALVAVAAVLLLLAGSLQAAAGGWRAAPRALWPPPTEVYYLVPGLAVLVGAAFTTQREIAPATLIIAAGGLGLSWLSGAALVASRKRGAGAGAGRALVHAALCATAVAGLCYIAIHRTGLIDMVIETVRFGPEG
jgi:hypothetical protein